MQSDWGKGPPVGLGALSGSYPDRLLGKREVDVVGDVAGGIEGPHLEQIGPRRCDHVDQLVAGRGEGCPPQLPSQAQEPVNRWGLDYNRITRVPRAGEAPPVRRIPPRVYPKLKIPEPYLKAAPRYAPRYGTPEPAIERIPPT